MAARSHAARKSKSLSGEPAESPAPQLPQTKPGEPQDPYVAAKLTRVRLHIDRLDAMLDTESDPQKIDKLASAITRLSELERQLSNRPLPGSFKPAAPKKQRPAYLSTPPGVVQMLPGQGPSPDGWQIETKSAPDVTPSAPPPFTALATPSIPRAAIPGLPPSQPVMATASGFYRVRPDGGLQAVEIV